MHKPTMDDVGQLWDAVGPSGNPTWFRHTDEQKEAIHQFALALIEKAHPHPGTARATLKSHDDTAVQATLIGLGTNHVTVVADGPIEPGVFYGYTVKD
jgi:hypothetical protein